MENLSKVDLAGVRVLGRNNCETGKGADVLGHFHAFSGWQNTLTVGLKEGDYVATGSIIPTIFPEPGESYHFDIGLWFCSGSNE